MILPERPKKLNVEIVDELPQVQDGWQPILNKHGISYMRSGNKCSVLIDDWIMPEYLKQAYELCGKFGITPGPSPSSTSLRLLQSFLQKPLGTCHSFSKYLKQAGVYGGGRAEVGKYGITEGPLLDIDFKSAYLTLLSEGPGDLLKINCPLKEADFIEATVKDDSDYPICRHQMFGRPIYGRSKSVRRLLTNAEFNDVEPLKVHVTYQIERRRDIASFAEVLLAFRDTFPVAKLLGNAVIGRLGIESNSRFIAVSRPRKDDTYVSPGVFAREVDSKPKGALCPSTWIIGTCRGHLTSLLREALNNNALPLAWDTDGTVTQMWNCPESWGPFKLKRREAIRFECWAAKISILTTHEKEEIRAGGIPGEPTGELIRKFITFPHLSHLRSIGGLLAKEDGTTLGRMTRTDGSTMPYCLDRKEE